MNYQGTIDVNMSECGWDLGHGTRLKYRRGVSYQAFSKFVSELKESNSYRLYQENTVGNNDSVTLVSDEGMLHLYYTDSEESVRIVSDTLEYFSLPSDDYATGEKVTDTTFCVMSLDYTHREVTDGNGMSYVIILEDGRFIVIDGGYYVGKDAERLYRFLQDNNRRADGKIVIAAWYMSHAHGDHYGCFERFTELYADKVTLQYWIGYPATAAMFDGGFDPWMFDRLPERLAQYGDVKWIRPHAGQTVRFCDTTLEFMYTVECHLPALFGTMNDSSTVTAITVKGQRILLMGDCEKAASGEICRQLGDALKSDIIQVNHHGYSGGSTVLYQTVAPAYSMWCTSELAFRFRTCGIRYQWIGNAVSSNKYLYDTVGAENCFVADGPVKMIHMPLTDKEKDITYYSWND